MLAFFSRTQKGLALSSGEAELGAQVGGVSEGLGIANVMNEMGDNISIQCWCDSSAARGIQLRAGAGRIRHLELKQLWVQDLVAKGKVSVHWLPRRDNPADALTHACSTREFNQAWSRVNIAMHDGRCFGVPVSGAWPAQPVDRPG